MAVSVNIKQSNGSLKKIAGNTILLDATCSEIREGTWTNTEVDTATGDTRIEVNITFDVPMPDTDYMVVFDKPVSGHGESYNYINVSTKSTTGFTFFATYTGNLPHTPLGLQVHWYAVRLVRLDGYTELQNKVSNPDSTPTENSTNLVTSGGVYEAIKNASSVFIGTSAEWESETSKTDYQVAILTDKPNVNAVDSTDGSTTVVGEPNKRYVGTKADWDLLSSAEKAKYEVCCFTDDGDASIATQFATISNEGVVSTVGDYICSKNGKNVCVMLKGHTNGIVTNSTKLYSGFFNPLTPNNYPYLDIPFAIRNRTTNVTEMRMGYLDATGNFYTSAYTEDIASDWDIQLFFSYQTK